MAVMRSPLFRPASAAGLCSATDVMAKPLLAALIHRPERSKVVVSAGVGEIGFRYMRWCA